MNTEHSALADLDSIAWYDLTHAYGPALDIPELLRQLVSASGEEADEVVEELYSSICHQGTVYPASVAAVAFLARLAASGVHTAELLALLGAIAEGSGGTCGLDEPDAARYAVAAQFDLLAPLAEHDHGEVRAAALAALANTGSADRVLAVLRKRWTLEADPKMRAEVLWAAMTADGAAAADLAEQALEDESGLLRVSAALAQVQAGRPWSERLRAAGIARIPGRARGSGWSRSQGLFGELVKATAEQCGADAAIDLVLAGLEDARGGPEEVLARTLNAAGYLLRTYRSAVEPVTAAVADLAGADGPGQAALALLELADARGAADAFHALAERSEDGQLADRALAALVRWGDPRAWALLACDLPQRPSALGAAVGFPFGPAGPPPAFDPQLLDAIRHRLREITAATRARAEGLVASTQQHNEPIHLSRVLQQWGPAAAPALPELIALLPHRPHPAAQALAAIGLATPEALAGLYAEADRGGMFDRVAVGRALDTLAADAQPLLATILHGLTRQRYDLREAAKAAADLTRHRSVLALPLARALEAAPAPSRTRPDLEARITLAGALWRHTADSAGVLPVLVEALGHSGDAFTGWPQAEAANLAAQLGESARELIPALDRLLDDPIVCPAAVRALIALDPEENTTRPQRDRFADRLITTVTDGPVLKAMDLALDMLGELGKPLPPSAEQRLHQLIGQDRRIATRLQEREVVHEDERLRARIRALLEQ